MKKTFIEEFKAFAVRGNVVDLAIAVVIGGAFGKIVTSLVEHIILPFAGVLTGGINFTHLSLTLREATATAPAVVFGYGAFLQSVLDFLIISFVIFIAIKEMNHFLRKEAEKPVEPPKPTKEQELLTEIRDLLKARQ